MTNFTLQDIETVRGMILGYKKNGRPRALWDVVTECSNICGDDKRKKKKSNKKKKRHKSKSKGLLDFYENAFNFKDTDF